MDPTSGYISVEGYSTVRIVRWCIRLSINWIQTWRGFYQDILLTYYVVRESHHSGVAV
jgi:hypothetical protein